jgi:hypothetical protein
VEPGLQIEHLVDLLLALAEQVVDREGRRLVLEEDGGALDELVELGDLALDLLDAAERCAGGHLGHGAFLFP